MMKRMISLLKTFQKCMRQKYFPTEQDISIKKWRADGGDYNLVPVHDLNENSLVFDVGGFHGDFAAEIYARYSCSIKIFEPVPQFTKQIKARFEKNHKIEVFEIGLGGNTSEETMSVNSVSSSTHRRVSGDSITIQIVDIVSWLKSHSIGYIDLMKINIEGGEYELLDKLLDSDYVTKVNELQIQFHSFFPNAKERMNKIQEKLSDTHQLTFQYPFIWENWKLKKN